MTDPSSAPWRRRRQGGSHRAAGQGQPAQSDPLPPQSAQRRRSAAFGDSEDGKRRTWIAHRSAASPVSSDSPNSAGSAASASSASSAGSAAAANSGAAGDAGTVGAAGSPPPTPGASDGPTAPSGPIPVAGRSRNWADGAPDEPATETLAPVQARGRRARRVQDDAAAAVPPASAPSSEPPAEPVEDDDTVHDAWSLAPAAPDEPTGPTHEAPREEPGSAPAADRAEPAPAAALAVTTASPASPVSPAPTAAHAVRATAEPAKRPLQRRPEPLPEGSLPKVAGWTVLTTAVPGTGLLTTRLRALGWVLVGILVAAVLAAAGFFVLGDPLRTGIRFLTSRDVLIGLMVVVALVGVVWALQIVLANLAQTTKERLQGAKRYLALGLAALMVVAVALPFGQGVRSLWAAQGLLGSESVFSGESGSNLQPGQDPWAGVGRLNIMLLGQDAGEDRTGTRPDTIMVASIDTETGSTALFSIPRNLEHVQFPEGTSAAEVFPDGFRYFGNNQDLINAVWTWAEDRPDLFPNDPEPGLTATTWAVEETLGLEMDYYAMVNLQGFEDMVDAIGGVDLVVERQIPIGGGASEVEGYIEPGQQHLDGFHALWYARSREGSNDFNRMCRQQRMVRAVVEEADPGTVALSIPGLVNATEENIVTNIPVSDLEAFVDLALRIKDGGFTSYPITQDVTPSYDADWDYLKEWVDASIEDSMQQEEPESVLGETEPGSTEPAPTGDAPSQEEGADGAEQPETDTEGTDEATGDEETSDSADGGTPTAEATEEPEIEQDPLQSCLPGADQEAAKG
ncbi:MAG TPA: LCP family protein [Candidatus Brachybacterium merdigallinarum]|nr:LCP family protein [Candidatus Brachybacterium merdigallinarum]